MTESKKVVTMYVYKDMVNSVFRKSKDTVLGYPFIDEKVKSRHYHTVCALCSLRRPINSDTVGKRFNDNKQISLITCGGTSAWPVNFVKVSDTTNLASAKRFPVLNVENLKKAMRCQNEGGGDCI